MSVTPALSHVATAAVNWRVAVEQAWNKLKEVCAQQAQDRERRAELARMCRQFKGGIAKGWAIWMRLCAERSQVLKKVRQAVAKWSGRRLGRALHR